MEKDVGLSSEEAKRKLDQFGKNALPEKKPPSDLSILLAQLKSPLVYVLFIAGSITLVLNHVADTVLIFSGVVINTVLGFIQERKADKALQALKELIHPKAKVIRDKNLIEVDVENIVPGDLVKLGQGDKIPADGKFVFTNRFFVNEAILTGESVPVGKDKSDKGFMGTIITSGKGKMVVEKTGEETEIGKIAHSVQKTQEDTPLRRQLTKFSKQLSIMVGLLILFVFIIGLITGKEIVEILITSVALAVSSIPEGLLVALTVVLAIGMQRILKRKGLVRNLMSAETLGGVTTICIDKTGTLTQGQMQVVDVIGDLDDLAKQSILANDLDDALVIAAYEWAKTQIKNPQNLVKKHKRIDSIPFSSKTRYFSSLNEWNKGSNMLFINGAPEIVLGWTSLDQKQKEKIRDQINHLTSEGKRVIGMARKTTQEKKLSSKTPKGLEWVGLLGLTDPIREGVAGAFEKTRKAGISTIVITGDYSQTAIEVMKRIDLEVDEKQVILGEKLEKTDVKELSKLLNKGVALFARTTPTQKLKIVEALKANNEIVAMMGDGVNDAPALKAADIGIVVEEASDVAKESADLVLLDSSFATIVASIEEGRGIFDNIRKIILYLLSDAFEEIVAVVGSLVLALPLPVSAAQILWINLVSDGFPDLALTIDPKLPDIMNRPPRDPKEKIVTNWMQFLIAIISIVGGLIALGLFAYFWKQSGDLILARSVAFASLGANSLIFVYSVRTLTNPFWKENPFANLWLNLAVIAGIILQLLPFTLPGLRKFFGVKFPGVYPLMIVFCASLVTFAIIEVLKYFVRKRVKWFQH